MSSNRGHTAKVMAVTAVVVVVVEAAGALGVRWLGVVDISAASPPSSLEAWLFGGATRASVVAHADPIDAIDHDDTELLAEGLEHYNEMCVTCHAAPGRYDSEVSRGLNPPAPHLWTADA